jgi:hypothetical protein
VLAWAAWITLLAAVLGVWSSWDTQAWAEFFGAAGLAWLIGLALAFRPGTDRARTLPDASLGTIALAAGAVLAILGALLGLWLTLIGAGLAVVGVGGILRERA